MARSLNEQKFLGFIAHLAITYAPRLKEAYNNFYRDPESYYRIVEDFKNRYDNAYETYKKMEYGV